jgi:cell division protein FtsB
MKFKTILSEGKVSFMETKILNALLKLGVSPDFQEVYEALTETLQFDYRKHSELMDRIMSLYDAYYQDYEDIPTGFKELMGTEFDEEEYQESINDDERARALALHKDIPIFFIEKTEYGEYYYRDILDDEEFLVLTDDEADKLAIEYAMALVDDVGAPDSYYEPDWEHIREYWESEAYDYVYNLDEEEQVEEAGKKDEYDELKEEIEEKEDEIEDIEFEVSTINNEIPDLISHFKTKFNEYNQLKSKIESGNFSNEDEKSDLEDDLYWLIDDLDTTKKEVIEYRDEKIEHFKKYKDLKYDIKILKSELEDLIENVEEEAQERYLESRIDDIEYTGVKEWYKIHFGYKTKDDLVKNGILDFDEDKYKNDVKGEREIHLAHYDHEENLETINYYENGEIVGGEDYYIYRTN